jgi:hypothetical protein
MKIGSLIECVNGTFTEDSYKWVPNRPVLGQHYIVRAIFNIKGSVGLHLEELHNPPTQSKTGRWNEPTFKIERFREIEGLDAAIEELLEESLLADI